MEGKRQQPQVQLHPAALRRPVLRLLSLVGRTYRVVTLRPGTDALFSTNYFHDTYHIVSDRAGAALLARLLWGLSYQRQPGTLILLHGEHLRPTPFDADPSDPILLVPAQLTPLDEDAFRALKARLKRLGPSNGTVRWQTHRLDTVRGDGPSAWHTAPEFQRLARDHFPHRGLWTRERMVRCGGFLCYSAPPAILREQALCVYPLGSARGGGMDYHYLAYRRPREGWGADGEVQVFPDYRRQLSDAAVARREVLARADAPTGDPQRLREAVWERREAVAQRRERKGRRRLLNEPPAASPSGP